MSEIVIRSKKLSSANFLKHIIGIITVTGRRS